VSRAPRDDLCVPLTLNVAEHHGSAANPAGDRRPAGLSH
jgi:hypothetical protein